MKSPNDKDLRTMFAPVRGARRGTTNVALNIQWPGDDPVSEMDFYAEAYHRAGRKLFDAIPKNDDYWFFSFDACPIIFLYWHALELHLKDAVVKGNSVMDRKSTRLNSSHLVISYAVFCLKKKIQ